MKKRIISMCMILMLLLMGCGNKEKLPEEKIVFDFFGYSLCKDGIINTMSEVLTITDYNSGVTVPLCDKPNCAHEPFSGLNENPQCNAAFSSRVITAFLYKDNLYIFLDDGMNHTTVYMANNTGGERRKIAEADYVCDYFGSMFCDGKLYFVGYRMEFNDNGVMKQEQERLISSFDVESQEFTMLTEPDKKLGDLLLCNVVGEELYYRKLMYKENGELVAVPKDYMSAEMVLYSIAENMETGEERFFLDTNARSCIVTDEGNIYYEMEKNGQYEYWKKMVTGEETFLFTADQMKPIEPIFDGEWLLPEDLSEFKKSFSVQSVYEDIVLVLDRNGKSGLITVDNYLNDVEEILYLDFQEVDIIM